MKTVWLVWLCWLTGGAFAAPPQTLLFRNGDVLVGRLEAIAPTNGLRWRHPDAPDALLFAPGTVTEVLLGASTTPAITTTNFCYVRLTNGDELAGNLQALNEQSLVLETWFAGPLTVPRARVASLRPAGPSPRALFTGPDGLEGWTMGKALAGNVNPGQWQFLNGAFVASLPASIARDVKLPPNCALEFDLAWRGQFALALALFTDSLQPVRLAQTADEPAFSPFYSLQVNSFSTQLLYVRHRDGARAVGMAVIPMLQQTNQAHFAIKCSRDQKTINLFINGVLAKQWADPEGFTGTGTGIRLVQQGMGPLRLANLRISEWDGRLDEAVAPLVPNVAEDVGRLVNRDAVTGRLVAMVAGKLHFQVGANAVGVEVPWDRVAQVDFATDRAQTAPARPGELRAYFTGRGSLTFLLESWTEQTVRLQSANFGAAEFRPNAFSRIVFPGQP